MIFDNRKNDEDKARAFVLDALIRHHKGDSQAIHGQLKAFLDSPAGIAMLEKYAELQQEVYAVWKMGDFGPLEKEVEQEGEAERLNQEGGIAEQSATLEEEAAENEGGTEEILREEIVEKQANESTEAPEVIHIEMENEVQEQDDGTNEEETEPEMNYNPRIHLANGKVQTPYNFDLHQSLPALDFDALTAVTAEGLEAAGLSLDPANLQVSGQPADAGQFPLRFALTFADGRTLDFHADLDILQDPRNLWKSLEPDADAPYPKPHTDAAQISGQGRQLLAASVRGRSHAHKAGFRDDDFAIDFLPESGWHLIAVADGAGSAPYSRRGAALACEVALAHLKSSDMAAFEAELLPRLQAYQATPDEANQRQVRACAYTPLSQAAHAAYKAIQAEAKSMDAQSRDFNTTLILTIARQFEFGWFVATWWVGDGGMGVYRQGESIDILGTPDGGEFAGQTRFLTMSDIWSDAEAIMGRISFHITDDFTALVLMSDGITDPKIETDHNLSQVSVWDQLWADLSAEVDFSPDNSAAPEQLLQWLQFWSPGNHDDRTIAILY